MDRRLVVSMLRFMRDHRWRGQRRHHEQAGHQGQNKDLSLESNHALLPGCCFYRLLFLNSRNDFIDLLFGKQSTFNVFLHASLLVDEDAHR